LSSKQLFAFFGACGCIMLQKAEAKQEPSSATAAAPFLQTQFVREGLLWETTEAERQLALELEKILGRKPTLQVLTRTPSPNSADEAPETDLGGTYDDLADADNFDWTRDRSSIAAVTAGAFSQAWLERARSQQRSNRNHNIAAWFSTLTIVAVILAAAAYVLTTDVPGVVAIRQLAWRVIE
jgi:hypothetical protein